MNSEKLYQNYSYNFTGANNLPLTNNPSECLEGYFDQQLFDCYNCHIFVNKPIDIVRPNWHKTVVNDLTLLMSQRFNQNKKSYPKIQTCRCGEFHKMAQVKERFRWGRNQNCISCGKKSQNYIYYGFEQGCGDLMCESCAEQ